VPSGSVSWITLPHLQVNAENAAAQVEAEACATIAKEVAELQAKCEAELAAAVVSLQALLREQN